MVEKKVDVVLNTPTHSRGPERDGMKIRRASVEHGVPCLTSLDTARALLLALTAREGENHFEVHTIDDYLNAPTEATNESLA